MASVALATTLATATATAGELPASPWSVPFGFAGAACSASTPPALPDLATNYYGIDMVPTKRIPGTGGAVGGARVTFARSPFGVSVDRAGEYVVRVSLSVERMKRPKTGVLTLWATKDDLSESVRLGALDESFRASGEVGYNKFLLVLTLEPSDAPAHQWSGPIVMRGMSRSGLMHTLAGHGPFEKEPCSKYGF